MQLLRLNDWYQNLSGSDFLKKEFERWEYAMHWIKAETDIMEKKRVNKGHD